MPSGSPPASLQHCCDARRRLRARGGRPLHCRTVKRLCVYAGSALGTDPAYRRAAVDLALMLAERRVSIVYGGASVGLMGVLADAALGAGGEVIGVIPQRLVEREVAHRGLSELRIAGSIHERKALMSELSDAALALPGGLGTLEEILEAATWAQLGIDDKPCGLLNVRGYYDPLVHVLDLAVDRAFLSPEHRRIVLVEKDPEMLLEGLAARSAAGGGGRGRTSSRAAHRSIPSLGD
jgi:uncharacterized protein (TIGR00730 family)